MRYLIAILSIAALVCVAGSADAFTGYEFWGYTDLGSETNPFMLYAIPDEYVPAIDGSLGDMAWMPEGMYFTLDTCPEVTEAIAEGNVPRDSFDMIVYGPAWVPATNSLYFGVRKVDDILYAPHPDITACWAEDCQQWYTDPSGAGGNYREEQLCNTAQQNFYTPKDGGHLSHFGPVEYDWRFEAPNGFFAQTLDEATGSYDMEVMYKLWDWLDVSEETSTLHIFEVDQLIGLGFSVRDVDIKGDVKKRANWQSADVWTDASLFPAFMVRPVSDTYALMATESSTWGGIKAMFK